MRDEIHDEHLNRRSLVLDRMRYLQGKVDQATTEAAEERLLAQFSLHSQHLRDIDAVLQARSVEF